MYTRVDNTRVSIEQRHAQTIFHTNNLPILNRTNALFVVEKITHACARTYKKEHPKKLCRDSVTMLRENLLTSDDMHAAFRIEFHNFAAVSSGNGF